MKKWTHIHECGKYIMRTLFVFLHLSDCAYHDVYKSDE